MDVSGWLDGLDWDAWRIQMSKKQGHPSIPLIVGSLATAAALLVGFAWADEAPDSRSGHEIPEAKQTSLGLYVSSAEAYEMWKTAPDRVNILDVRTPEEYIFVGHADMAWNVPLAFQSYEWDTEKNRFTMDFNPDFVTQVKTWADPADTILVMCRSGGRSAMAVDALAEAGFQNVYNIIDGVEGDKVDDPGSIYHGKRLRNGWKNSGPPWGYALDPERMLISKPETK